MAAISRRSRPLRTPTKMLGALEAPSARQMPRRWRGMAAMAAMKARRGERASLPHTTHSGAMERARARATAPLAQELGCMQRPMRMVAAWRPGARARARRA